MLFQRSLTAYWNDISVGSPVFRTEFSRQVNPPSVSHLIHIDLQPLKKPFFHYFLEKRAIFIKFAEYFHSLENEHIQILKEHCIRVAGAGDCILRQH